MTVRTAYVRPYALPNYGLGDTEYTNYSSVYVLAWETLGNQAKECFPHDWVVIGFGPDVQLAHQFRNGLGELVYGSRVSLPPSIVKHLWGTRKR